MKFDLSDKKITAARLIVVWGAWIICMMIAGGLFVRRDLWEFAFLARFAAGMGALFFLAYLILLPHKNFRLLIAAFHFPGYRCLLAAFLIGVLAQFGVVGIPGLDDAISGDFSLAGKAAALADTHLINLWSMIYISFMLPMMEELFFRGLLLSYLCTKMRAGPALWLSALIFTLWRFLIEPSDNTQILILESYTGVFISGIILGYLYLKTANLWAPIIAHAGANIANDAVSYIAHLADSGSAAAGFALSSLLGLNALNYALIALTVIFTLYIGLRGWNRRLNPLQLQTDVDAPVTPHQTAHPLFLFCLNIPLAIGAFIPGLLFFFAGLYEETSTSVIVALMLVAGAVWLQKQVGGAHWLNHIVLTQSSLAVMVTGKLWFLVAFGGTLDYYLARYGYDPLWSNTLALLIITALTYPIYRVPVDRFLSPFMVLYATLYSILEDTGEYSALLFHPLFLFQFVAAAVLLTHEKMKPDYIPLAYTLVFSLCMNVLFLNWVALTWDDTEIISSWFASLVLSGGLIALFSYVAGGMAKLKTAPLWLAVTGAALLGLISAPGILLAIVLIVLGYTRHERLLLTTGAVLIPVFLFLYYHLDPSLLQKSGVLVGSGTLLLAARLYLRYRGQGASAKNLPV